MIEKLKEVEKEYLSKIAENEFSQKIISAEDNIVDNFNIIKFEIQ